MCLHKAGSGMGSLDGVTGWAAGRGVVTLAGALPVHNSHFQSWRCHAGCGTCNHMFADSPKAAIEADTTLQAHLPQLLAGNAVVVVQIDVLPLHR